MRFVINGKTYKLRENIVIRMQGITLAIVSALCFITGADTAGIFFAGLAALMLFPYSFLYWVAEKIVQSERRN